MAQDKTESKEVFLRIDLLLPKNDSLLALIYQGGKDIGIHEGMLIKAYQGPQDAIPGVRQKREFKEVGWGKVVYANEKSSGCFVQLYHRSDSLETGDLVSVTLNIPAIPYRSIFSELAFQAIEFQSMDKEPLYSLKDIFFKDSRKTEDSITGVIINDIHNTYERVKDRQNLPESLKVPASVGRFKGKTALESLRDATKKDLESFLLYVKTYTGGYMGKNYRASESFAGWLITNSPYSAPEIKNALFPVYKNKNELARLMPVYKNDILAESVSKSFSEEAIARANEFKYDEALQLIDFAGTLANAVNDTAGKASVYLNAAQIYQDREQYDQAIAACNKSIEYALLAGKKDIELQAIMKKAYCLYKISQYAEAKKTLALAETKLENYRSAIGEDVYYNNLQKRYEYEGSINYVSGNYTQALENYAKAIDINARINSYDARIRNAKIYKFIGNVYNEQRQPESALRSFIEASEIYKNINDLHNWSRVINNIAYSYYNLSNYKSALQYLSLAMEQLLKSGDYNEAGYSKSLMGSCYWELGQYNDAVIAHKESIALREKSNNLSGQAFSWKQIGELYQLSGLKNNAFAAFDSAANIYRNIQDNSGLAETYNKKGKVYYNDEHYLKAVELYEKARGIDNKTTIEALYNLGSAWLELDTAQARMYYTLCRQISDSTGNTFYHFYSAKALAGMAYRAYNFKLGDNFYEECARLSRQMNTPLTIGYCLELKGHRFNHQSLLDSALFYYRKALAIFDTVSKNDAVWGLNSMASVFITRGEFSRADQVLTEAATIAGKVNNNLGLGYSLQAVSFLYGLLGEFAKGIKASDSAIAIFNRTGNMLRLANTYTSRGTLLKSMGKYKESIDAYLFADSIYLEQMTHYYRATVLNNIGVTYYNQADYKKASQYFEMAIKTLGKDIINEDYLLYKSNLAECLYYLKKSKEAENIYQEVYPLAKKKDFNRISSGMAITLGKIYFDAGQHQKSFQYFREAMDYGMKSSEKEKIIEAALYLAKLELAYGKIQNAEKYFQEAIGVTKNFKVATGWEAFYEAGVYYFNQKKFDSAIAYLKEGVELVEEISGNIYGGEEAQKIYKNDPRKFDLYSKIVSSLAEKGNVDDAWVYANRSNITGIKELLGNLPTQSGDLKKNEAIGEANLLFQQQNALDKKINELQAKPDKERSSAQLQSLLEEREIAGAKYLKYIDQLKIKYPDLRAYFSENVNPEQFKNYKGLLPDDAAVVLYIVNDNKLLIFTVTNENTSIHINELKEDISTTIKQFTSLLKTPGKSSRTGPLHLRSELDEEDATPSASFTTIAGNLYSLLIGNIRDKIASKKKLCIIPNGDLSNIAFQCLGQKMPDSSFRFLVEDYSIFYTNQLDVFKNREPQKENISSFAAFGVPDKTLHFTQQEAESIVSILKLNIPAFVNTAATEKAAKANLSEKRFVHFATHGILNYTDILQSYLKFLPDKDTSEGNNGQLTINEIKELDISGCELVTLSACETAVNKELAKGWQISPANSFLLNRVRSVVATLWKVDDEATSILMDAFYGNLNKQMDKVDALRQAQVTLSRDPRFSHPYYWGAFVLFGDWR